MTKPMQPTVIYSNEASMLNLNGNGNGNVDGLGVVVQISQMPSCVEESGDQVVPTSADMMPRFGA